jgi:hypothetical protein
MRTNVNEIRLSALLFDVTVVFTNEEKNLVLKVTLRLTSQPVVRTFPFVIDTAANAANG